MAKNLYLTNEQYLGVLDMIESKIDNIDTSMVCDSNATGDKSVSSNIGFCNDEFTTLETSLFPDLFENGRKAMKYRAKAQACPFDNRVRTKENLPGRLMTLDCGCFYTCGLNSRLSTDQLKSYVADTRNKFLTGELDKINEILRR